MNISNGDIIYDIVENNINYIRLYGNELTFVYKNNTITPIMFSDRDTLTLAINKFVKLLHKKLSTIGAVLASLGIIYWLNMSNVYSFSQYQRSVDVRFIEGNSLTMYYVNADEATNGMSRLNFDWKIPRIYDLIKDKTKRYVNPAFVTNETTKLYSSYTAARSSALSGDVIIFDDCTINLTTERFPPKTGVDIIFEDTIINITQVVTHAIWFGTYTANAIPLFHDNAEIVNCDIFGSAKINLVGIINYGWSVIDLYRNESNVNMEFDQFAAAIPNPTGASFTHLYGGSIRLKGRKAIHQRLYDSDDMPLLGIHPVLIDIDVLDAKNDLSFDGILMLPYDVDTYRYHRNGYYIGGIYANGYQNDVKYSFINMQINDAIGIGYGCEINLWRLITTQSVYDETSGGRLTINHNQSYAKNSSAILETTPVIIIDPNLTLQAPVNFGVGKINESAIPGFNDMNYFTVYNLYITIWFSEFDKIDYDFNDSPIKQFILFERHITATYFWQLATIPDYESGEVYKINVDRVTSYAINGGDLGITFTSGNSISISCLDVTDEYNTFDFVWWSRRTAAIKASKTVLTVNPLGGANYTSIQAAINASNPITNFIEVQEGIYTAGFVCDGTDMEVNENAIIENTIGKTIEISTPGITQRIFGKGVYNNLNPFGYDATVSTGDFYDNNPILYLQYDSLKHHDGRVVAYQSGKLRLMGKLIQNDTIDLAPFDWDASADLLHINCLELKSVADGIFITFQNLTTAVITFLNCHFQTIGANFFYTSSVRITTNIVNCLLNTLGYSPPNIMFTDDSQIINMYNTFLKNKNASFSIENTSGGTLELNCKTNIYADEPVQNNVTVNGNYIVSEGFYDEREIGHLEYIKENDYRFFMYAIENATTIKLYEDDIEIYSQDMQVGEDFIYEYYTPIGEHEYKVKAFNGFFETEFSNPILITYMPLSNFPLEAKYCPPDIVYAEIDYQITRLTIEGCDVIVGDPQQDSIGVQVNTYTFVERPELNLIESKLFSSRNALLAHKKGHYLNGEAIVINGVTVPSAYMVADDFTGLVDAGGLDLGVNLTSMNFTNVVVDGTTFVGATLPVAVDTKAEMRSVVGSYDKVTTKWTDGTDLGT